MKFTTTLVAAGLTALVSAQGPIFNANGTFTCPDPQGAYCAGGNIIIRCNNGVGQPGNCDDNLSGEPPLGVNYAPCYTCGANSSRSACSKNGIVYPGSGAGLGSAQFFTNDTAVCAAPAPAPAPAPSAAPAPYTNGTTPSSPVANSTKPAGVASPTGSGAAGASGSAVPIPYTGAASSVQFVGAGLALYFGTLFAALL
ncbi:hypothetical protein LTR91_005946 [Friedmanniomyces endolithicus]|uniref:Uncharacterized protein n=1 Tax=Friedmanniomyces endolithicus TaxID=329885 RepID=A0AAN6KTC0_9PEZI|nr:hypothetical protein LTR94_006712 [Friedmanniomyces endolithicus]KAK0808725.1 hypothetical protein LTR59_002878 [Friedmanniomyces endolithicus]KAK0813042.1 hypothetical protein LTR38_003117 [Friedmanniomyces endolithicus]KAK0819986.1 hypothetical protein LTR75_001756 [Friedmanniomyces endolithicus]KAK0844077.1 hypothetical protein LTR03_008260 [Friedmanniomyces endolithicus]